MDLCRSLPDSTTAFAIPPVLGLLVLVPCLALVMFAMLASAGVTQGPALLAGWLGANLVAVALCLSRILSAGTEGTPLRLFRR